MFLNNLLQYYLFAQKFKYTQHKISIVSNDKKKKQYIRKKLGIGHNPTDYTN